MTFRVSWQRDGKLFERIVPFEELPSLLASLRAPAEVRDLAGRRAGAVRFRHPYAPNTNGWQWYVRLP